MKISVPSFDLQKIKAMIPQKYLPAALLAGLSPKAAPKVTGPVRVLACDYGASKIILLEAVKDGGKITLERFDLMPRSEEPGKAAALIKETIQKGYGSTRVRVSVKGQSVIVRFVQFPKMKTEDLRSAINYEAENYIPFKLDEVILDFYVLEESAPGANGGEMMNVLLIAVKKEEIYPLIKDFQDAELQVELIDIDTLAAINALEFLYPEEFKSSVALMDLGKEVSSLSVIRDGKPRFIRDISFGGIDIQKRLRRKLGLSLADAEKIIGHLDEISPEALQVLKEGYETLCTDLKVTLDYYQGQTPDGKPVEKFFLAGGSANPKWMVETFNAHLGVPVQAIEVLSRVELAPAIDKALLEKNQRLLAVALGLCLRHP